MVVIVGDFISLYIIPTTAMNLLRNGAMVAVCCSLLCWFFLAHSKHLLPFGLMGVL